jgi:hypothetical protein
MTLSGIETATFRLVAQRLCQPSHNVPLTVIYIDFAAKTPEENVKGKFISPSIYHNPMIYVFVS